VVQEFSLAQVVGETLRVYRDLLAAVPNAPGGLTFLEQKVQ